MDTPASKVSTAYSLNAFEKRFHSLLTQSLAVAAPSGWETCMAGFIKAQLDALGYAHETDAAGNVTVRLAGANPSASLCVLGAHLDEIGLVVTHIELDGNLRVDRSGGCSPGRTGERIFMVFGDQYPITAVLSLPPGQANPDQPWQGARLITGLTPSQLTERGIRVGSAAVPSPEGRGPVLLGDPASPLIGAWTFDDRAGLLIQLILLEELKRQDLTPLHPTLVTFTVQEEQGAHGAKIVAHREKPELFIAVDGCPWRADSGIVVDERPAVWSKDKLATYDQSIVRLLSRCAREAGTQIQTSVQTNANSDASQVFAAGAVPRIALIGHTRYNSHGFEVARLSVFENTYRTLLRFITSAEW